METDFGQRLDYSTVLFFQIERILKSLSALNAQSAIVGINALQALLTPYLDEKFLLREAEIKNKKRNSPIIGRHGPETVLLLNRDYSAALEVFAELVKLAHRGGLLPREKTRLRMKVRNNDYDSALDSGNGETPLT